MPFTSTYDTMFDMSELIEARVLKGFRDYPPELEIQRQDLVELLQRTFRKFGFLPIDTPALEFSEVLLRKSNGETEKQVFRFTDNGGRDVALRFDLTVPLARFIAEHHRELTFPFKRYQIANVWRGEKPQAGRFREFKQCDFDIIGEDNAENDFEILNVIVHSFLEMDGGEFCVHISHRGLFNKLLEKLSIREKSDDILRTVDKLAKIGKEEVSRLLGELTTEGNVRAILDFVTATENAEQSTLPELLKLLEDMVGGPCPESERLKEVYGLLRVCGIDRYVCLDPSITRGLDYYTGIVYETFFKDLPTIGSVCSGGRYNNLTGLYMKESITGVGASIGLDRMLAALEQMGRMNPIPNFVQAVIFYDERFTSVERYRVAHFLRQAGIPVDIFTENKKMTTQYAWAESKNIPYGIFLKEPVIGLNIRTIKIELKLLKTRQQKTVTLDEAVKQISITRLLDMREIYTKG